MPTPLRTLLMALIVSFPHLCGCGGSNEELDAASALEESGDLFGALAAYDALGATEAAAAVRQTIAERLVADGAPLFELPETCEIVRITGVEAVDVGTRVDLELDCDGRKTATSGRAISFDKVWDLAPVTGTLVVEGECVFRSHDNPFGDWAIALPAEECERERRIRVDALVAAVGEQASEAFSCDCRMGEATFEIPRGEPMWKTGPPPIPTESLPEGTQKMLEDLQDKSD